MDYKKELRVLKEKKDWEKLLSSALNLYQDGNSDRYIIKNIVLAYEQLHNREEVVPFWQILAKGENRPEIFSSKLVNYYKEKGNSEEWQHWSKKLLAQCLKKKDFDTLEDVWMQLLEAESIDINFALEITKRILSLEKREEAYTLLELFLMWLENKKPQSPDTLEVMKRLLDIKASHKTLKEKLESFYKTTYSDCQEIDNFIHKADIKGSDNPKEAIDFLEKLIKLCPGRYVSHKSWGVGFIKSVDLIFDKIFIDFPARPNHSIYLNMAINILTPLKSDDFKVLKITNRERLFELKKENPASLIKLLLGDKKSISQREVKQLLEGIVSKKEWLSFVNEAKKKQKKEGIEIKRKGSTYSFSHFSISVKKNEFLEKIGAAVNKRQKANILLKTFKNELAPDEKIKWLEIAENIIESDDIEIEKRLELLFAKMDITDNNQELNRRIDLLLNNKSSDQKIELLNRLSQKSHKKRLFKYLREKESQYIERIFLETSDNWLRKEVQKNITEKDTLVELQKKVMHNPLKYPYCFLYLAEHFIKTKTETDSLIKPIILFETVLEFMKEQDIDSKIRTTAKTIFSKYGFDMYNLALKTSSKEEIKVLLDIVREESTISSTDKKRFQQFAESKHSTLQKSTDQELIYATSEAIKSKKKELDKLLKIEIPKNSEKIGKAAAQGDLSENFDYISAKEKQRKLISRVNVLKQLLAKTRPIEDLEFVEGEVGIGTYIVLEDESNKQKREIVILGPWDSVYHKEVVSHSSPLASKLIGKKVGEKFLDNYNNKVYRIKSVKKFQP
jgi:transcription elongation factor GreB